MSLSCYAKWNRKISASRKTTEATAEGPLLSHELSLTYSHTLSIWIHPYISVNILEGIYCNWLKKKKKKNWMGSALSKPKGFM